MRRDDSVFFFTLVDFLLTSLFFGLVLFVIASAPAPHEDSTRAKAAALDSIRKAAGISDLTVLTDELTRLGPLRDMKEAKDIVAAAGGPTPARKAIEVVRTAGGPDTILARLARLKQHEGAGKPHCLPDPKRGGNHAFVLARTIATDSTISFVSRTAQLDTVLSMIGVTFDQVRVMRLADFRRTFDKLVEIQPNCLYTIDFVERTPYIYARDAVRGRFYPNVIH